MRSLLGLQIHASLGRRSAILIVSVLLLLVPAIGGLLVPSVSAFSNGQNASVVLRQLNFGGVGPNRANGPEGVAFDSAGNMWVADFSGNRVLEFARPFTNGMSASLVLGQPDFVSSGAVTTQSGMSGPDSVAFDPNGNMWVVDYSNQRVLRFSPPFSNGMNANLVIGQTFFTTSQGYGIITASSLYYSNDARFDAVGNLWIADCGNNRVLSYSPPFTRGMRANLVLGQSAYGT
jgi:sugar lactone lactonase YvrE